MYSKNFVFYITCIAFLLRPGHGALHRSDSKHHDLALRPNVQYDDYNTDYDESVQVIPTTTMKTVVSEEPKIYKYTSVAADKGEDLKIYCNPLNENESAKWLNIQPNSDISITPSDGLPLLSISNVTHDHTYECKHAENIVERFVITVNCDHAKIINYSSGFALKGKQIHLSCVVRSSVPVTTSYLRVKNVKYSQRHVAHWESKRRICKDMDFNRTDCQEETTIQYSVTVNENGVYFCGFEDTESVGHHIEVISSADPVIVEATGECTLQLVQKFMAQSAIEALENHGMTTKAANYMRETFNVRFRIKNWNCIIGRQGYEFSMSPDILSKRSSCRVSLGSVFFTLFRTKP